MHNEETGKSVVNMILIKLDVNGIFTDYVETNEYGIIVIDSTKYPTMPLYSALKLTVFNDFDY